VPVANAFAVQPRVSSAHASTALWKRLSVELKSCGLLTNLDLEGLEAFVEDVFPLS
jgi:hypothetical protein